MISPENLRLDFLFYALIVLAIVFGPKSIKEAKTWKAWKFISVAIPLYILWWFKEAIFWFVIDHTRTFIYNLWALV